MEREYAGSTLEEAQAFFSIVMVRVAVCVRDNAACDVQCILYEYLCTKVL